jgi:membrane protein
MPLPFFYPMRKSVLALGLELLESCWLAIRCFFRESGLDKASILAYYSIFSSFFLLFFFSYIFTRMIGSADGALKSMFPFSPDFFAAIEPIFLERANDLSSHISELGLISIVLFAVLAILVFKKMIQFINDMFLIKIKKGFMLKRLQEFALTFLVGGLAAASFFISGFISTILANFYDHRFVFTALDPNLVDLIDNVLVRYLVPFVVTGILFFILFKWIPEKKVSTRAALVAALLTAISWEITKGVYSYYLIHYSIMGKIKGPVIAIIMFGFWMEISMSIMLWGAKLASILDRGIHAHPA